MRTATRPEPDSDRPLGRQIAALDTLYESAGLVRQPRSRAVSESRRKRQQTREKSDRTRVSGEVRLAANGVRWLPVPGWEKLGWLWHGFSTRQGGRSRAYALDGAESD